MKKLVDTFLPECLQVDTHTHAHIYIIYASNYLRTNIRVRRVTHLRSHIFLNKNFSQQMGRLMCIYPGGQCDIVKY